jgi:hypothetical protein
MHFVDDSGGTGRTMEKCPKMGENPMMTMATRSL